VAVPGVLPRDPRSGPSGLSDSCATVCRALFTDEIRCPVHVTDLASALIELTLSPYSGVHHVAGAEAVSRYELGMLIARRDGLAQLSLDTARRADRAPAR
jgi:dTDP-4-dehydrorhamnose reductase